MLTWAIEAVVRAEEMAMRPEPDRPGGAGGDPAAREGQRRAASPGREARGEPCQGRKAARQEEVWRSAGEGGEARHYSGSGVSSIFA